MPQKYVQNVQSLSGLFDIIFEISMCVYGILKAINPEEYIISGLGNAGIHIVLVAIISLFSLLQCTALNLVVFLEGTMKNFSMSKLKQEDVMIVI